MKKNLWLKKIGCLTMAAIFSLAFVACGDKGGNSGRNKRRKVRNDQYLSADGSERAGRFSGDGR